MIEDNKQETPENLRTILVSPEVLDNLFVYDEENKCYESLTDFFKKTCAEEVSLEGYQDMKIDVFRNKKVQAIAYSSTARMKFCCWPSPNGRIYVPVPIGTPCGF
jgi:hypothetical protein